MTRARQLLVFPRGFDRRPETWAGVLGLDLEILPVLELDEHDRPSVVLRTSL
jgi:hypothetical protein